MATNTDFINGENKDSPLKKILANTESSNDSSVKNDDLNALVNPDLSEQLTLSKQSEDTSENEFDGYSDTDALTTMNAIMAYNRQLVSRLQELEQRIEEQGEELSNSVKDAVSDLKETLPDHNSVNQPKPKAKEDASDFTQHMPSYNRSTDTKGTNHSFEFPIGDALMSSGNFNTTPLNDKQDKEEPKKKNEDEETVNGDEKDTGNGGGIRISDGDKDDIVIKVEATKKGITFSIHIPRN